MSFYTLLEYLLRVPTPINNPINNHAVENLRTVVKIAIDISFDDDWYAN